MQRAQLFLDTDLSNLCLVLSSGPWWLLLWCHGRGQVPGIAGALKPFYQGLPSSSGRRWQQILSKWTASCTILCYFITQPCPCFLSLFAGLSALFHQSGWYLQWLPEKLPLSATSLRNQADKTPQECWGCFALPHTLHHTCHGASCRWGASGHCTLRQCQVWCENPSGPAELKAAVQGELLLQQPGLRYVQM